MPVIAAGGICDGPTMAAAFALGAEGVQMGTRMVSAAESPVHANWKQAIVDAAETDTVFLNRHASPALAGAAHRAHERARVRPRAQRHRPTSATRRPLLRRRHGGGIALSGQVAGRIDEVRPVAEIISECAHDCLAVIADLDARYNA